MTVAARPPPVAADRRSGATTPSGSRRQDRAAPGAVTGAVPVTRSRTGAPSARRSGWVVARRVTSDGPGSGAADSNGRAATALARRRMPPTAPVAASGITGVAPARSTGAARVGDAAGALPSSAPDAPPGAATGGCAASWVSARVAEATGAGRAAPSLDLAAADVARRIVAPAVGPSAASSDDRVPARPRAASGDPGAVRLCAGVRAASREAAGATVERADDVRLARMPSDATVCSDPRAARAAASRRRTYRLTRAEGATRVAVSGAADRSPGTRTAPRVDAARRTALSGEPADVARATSGMVPAPEGCPDGAPGPLARGGGAGDRRRRSIGVIIGPAALTSRACRNGRVRGAAVTDIPPGCLGASLGTPRATRRRPRAGSVTSFADPASGRAADGRVPAAAPATSSGEALGRHHRGARTVASREPTPRTLAGTPMTRRTARERPVAAPNRTDRAARWPTSRGGCCPSSAPGRRKRVRIAAPRGTEGTGGPGGDGGAGSVPVTARAPSSSSPGSRCAPPRAPRRAARCCRRGTPVRSIARRRPGRTPMRAGACLRS